MSLLDILGFLATGLVAGTLGGLLGIGGGAVMVPALDLVFGENMRLAIASSLFCMIFLSISSAYGHWKNGFLLKGVLVELVPVATVSAIAGVYIGGAAPVWVLYGLFAIFLFYTAYSNTRKILSSKPGREEIKEFTPPNRWLVPLIAVPMGLSCGMLGIGGGVIAVPALNMILKLPFKNAIANSSATILFSSTVAAIVQMKAINGMEVETAAGMVTLHWWHAAVIGGVMAPTALIFGRLGAHLTKVSPTKVVRAIFVVLVLWGGYKYAVKFRGEVGKRSGRPAVEAVSGESGGDDGGEAAAGVQP